VCLELTWKKLYKPAPTQDGEWPPSEFQQNHLPKMMISVESTTFKPHDAKMPSKLGSWKAELTVKGAGGAGSGWKYGLSHETIRFQTTGLRKGKEY